MAIGAAQLTYNLEPAIARPGMSGDLGPKKDYGKFASGPVKCGLGVFNVAGYGPATHPRQSPGGVWQNPTPTDPAAATTAIATSHATVDAGYTFVGAGLTGAIGGGDMFPGRKITAVLSNHADFDADPIGCVFTYVDALTGATVTEVKAVPDAGNTTLTTTGYARSVVSVAFTALSMSGTGGAITIGVAALDASIVASDFMGVAMYDPATIESGYPQPLASGTDDSIYVDGATVRVRRVGSVWVKSEDAPLEGAAVYCRIAAGSFTQLGAFRTDTDSATAILIPGARWERNSAIGGLNKIYLGY